MSLLVFFMDSKINEPAYSHPMALCTYNRTLKVISGCEGTCKWGSEASQSRVGWRVVYLLDVENSAEPTCTCTCTTHMYTGIYHNLETTNNQSGVCHRQFFKEREGGGGTGPLESQFDWSSSSKLIKSKYT